ncbi:DUF3592 domain-containing protein [Mucilaginibacter angelicae]|uniref:DUF3592 domain-containing protein n=1 Tax=Mucilaginibacter angelicae TaxID=869718 RepID=A0ABV6LEB9_9SPHI
MIIDILLYSNHSTSSSNPTITALVLGVIGAVLTLVGAIMYDRRKKLMKTGIQVEGIVFSIEHEVSSNDSMGLYYPVIRYLTLQNEWITKKYDIGISGSSAYKEGDSVVVIYDPNENSVFTLNDTTSKIIPLVFLLIGGAMLVGAIVVYAVK